MNNFLSMQKLQASRLCNLPFFEFANNAMWVEVVLIAYANVLADERGSVRRGGGLGPPRRLLMERPDAIHEIGRRRERELGQHKLDELCLADAYAMLAAQLVGEVVHPVVQGSSHPYGEIREWFIWLWQDGCRHG